MLVYKNIMHLNSCGEHCHGSMVSGFRYALGVDISESMKHKIAQMHVLGLFPAQIMQQHIKEVRDWRSLMALSHAIPSYCHHMLGTFVEDGVMVREAGTLHDIQRATLMAQCYSALS